MEKTFLLIKPDGVRKKLIGEILKRTEDEGFKILDLKMARLSTNQASKFYRVHKGKPFFEKLVKFICSGEVVAVLLGRNNAVRKLREIVGATDPREAKRGTIRYDLATDVTRNVVHASDSAQSFRFESKFFF
ncbi:MAG: nucleoside-diphosphate kinase [candidate division Zixibacteria bacterium]|nr:nucleoside-diphosphate kinase [candidate division Zixibacteria bacterium]